MTSPSCTVNGEVRSLDGWLGCRLLDYLREAAGHTGAKEACSEGECGACTVLIDGEPVCSCLTFTDMVAGRDIVTVEGVEPALLDRLEAEIDKVGGVQCGFCTPGFTVMTQWLARQGPEPDVKALLEGNLCRCTGYTQLHTAISRAIATVPGEDGDGHDA
jgi:aerobic-type carbon monoxide dehydrogenase small subunit (CoxS/CutS family)